MDLLHLFFYTTLLFFFFFHLAFSPHLRLTLRSPMLPLSKYFSFYSGDPVLRHSSVSLSMYHTPGLHQATDIKVWSYYLWALATLHICGWNRCWLKPWMDSISNKYFFFHTSILSSDDWSEEEIKVRLISSFFLHPRFIYISLSYGNRQLWWRWASQFYVLEKV